MLLLTMIALLVAMQLAADDEDRLAAALERRLTFPSSLKSGRPAHVGHCARAPEGCRVRAETFAAYFFDEGASAGVSPWLLAAVAVQESRLRPAAEGSCGKWTCRGIMQIHERWRGAPPYIRSERTRGRCNREVGACQRPVVSFAADLLKTQIERCGSTAAGLGAYNTGRCGRGAKYARRIDRELMNLRELARETEAENVAVPRVRTPAVPEPKPRT